MTGRTMTIQTQTPGGQDQPIPVKDAVEAVQAALEVCKEPPGDLNWRDGDYKFGVMARAMLQGTLEYLLADITSDAFKYHSYIDPSWSEYAAVAPIVAWWRQSGAQGGGK